MANIRSIHLRELHGRLGEVAYQLTRVQFSRFSASEAWQPAINAYRCSEGVAICVDLAGVDRRAIQLEVEPKRLRLRGQRQAPEPEGATSKPVQVLVMEIDYGPFERELLLPCAVDPAGVTAEHRTGFLWIYLPLQSQA